MLSAVFLIWFFAAALWTINALRPPVPPGRLFPPPWLPAMLVSELAPWLLVGRIVIAAAFVALGALDSVLGMVGLGLLAISEAGALILMSRSIRSARALGSSASMASVFRVWDPIPAGAVVIRDVEYWGGLTLDVYRHPDTTSGPTLIYLHPGSWMRGRPGRQARPMFHRLLARGWVVLDIRYPLSPRATFPDHLVGVKRAIAWAKSKGRDYGIDPDRIVTSGGSSGAHLAALASLTWDNGDLQPGFEAADTSVFACITYYGIYDLFVRHPTRYDWPFVARHVLKATNLEAPDLYRLGSPVDQARGDAPPFLVIHGDFDSVVLAEESHHFVKALADAGASVAYREIKWAQHGFDAISSLRSRAVGEMAALWLDELVASEPGRASDPGGLSEQSVGDIGPGS